MEKLIEGMSVLKYLKGQLDPGYRKWPGVGNTFAGGKVDYQFIVTNTSSEVISSFEAVDILPHIGDKGVLLNTTPRGTQFPIYMTGEMETLRRRAV